MQNGSEDNQDFSTELLFEREFDPSALNYNGVRVEYASMAGKALTLLANAVFNSAFVLGEWIDRGFLNFADGRSVLELGAGTGFPTLRLLQEPSISVARAVITDYPAEEIMVTLKRNASRNGALDRPNVHVNGLDWYKESNIEEVLALNNGYAYDVILAADLLWYTDAHAALVDCISRTLRKPSSSNTEVPFPARALVPSGTYAKREDVRSFLKLAERAGLKWREMDLDTPFLHYNWNRELDTVPDYEWHGTLNIHWEDKEGRRESCTPANLAGRKRTVYAFELQWA